MDKIVYNFYMPIVISPQRRRLVLQGAIVTACLSVFLLATQIFAPDGMVQGEKIATSPTPSPTLQTGSTYTEEEYLIPEDEEPIYITPKTTQITPAPSVSNLVSCGLNNNSTYVSMTKPECDKLQSEENERIRNSYNTYYVAPSFAPWSSLAPFPSIEPYKPSQEYLDEQKRLMDSMSEEWKPTQFVAPSPKCNPVGDGFNCF